MQPAPVFVPGESHGQRSQEGYSPWEYKESDTTEATFIYTSRSYAQGPARDKHRLGGYASHRIWAEKRVSLWESGECHCQAWIWPPGRPGPRSASGSLRPSCGCA